MNAHKVSLRNIPALFLGIILMVSFLSAGCSASVAESASVQSIQELTVCSWEDDAIGVVINDFFMAYGIRIQLFGYSSQEEIIEKIRAGFQCDLLVIQSDAIPALVEDGLIAEIDYTNVPNFRNISVNFRNLAYDSSNKYSIPYNWGTTGLIVRNDLVGERVFSWQDLWDANYEGKVAIWASRPRYTIGAILLSLGYSANSENPQELEAAFQLLSLIKQQTVWIEHEDNFVRLLQEGKVWFGMGWADNFWLAKEGAGTFQYILPSEGSILWSSVFTIPKNSTNKKTAAILINYLLDPEVSAKIINQGHYAIPNDLATPFVSPELLADPSIYPPDNVMQNSEILLPLSEQGQYLHDQIWQRFRSVAVKGSD